MMKTKDIRWEQRFSNFKMALSQLKKFIDKGDLSDLEAQGLIKAFEYTYELSWNTLKDYLEFGGQTDIHGPRDVIRKAFKLGIIEDGEGWMDMLQSRNLTSHTYREEVAEEIAEQVSELYYFLLTHLEKKLDNLHSDKDKSVFDIFDEE